MEEKTSRRAGLREGIGGTGASNFTYVRNKQLETLYVKYEMCALNTHQTLQQKNESSKKKFTKKTVFFNAISLLAPSETIILVIDFLEVWRRKSISRYLFPEIYFRNYISG